MYIYIYINTYQNTLEIYQQVSTISSFKKRQRSFFFCLYFKAA